MSTARFIIGDCLEELRKLDDNSVDLVFSSPPFLALRSYLPDDHPDKAKEIGSEPTPGDFIDTLLDVTEECARVLAPHGSLCFELGDTYSGSGGAGGDYNVDGWRENEPPFVGSGLKNRGKKRAEIGAEPPETMKRGADWPLPKSLCLIPESFRWALAYGRNPFNGRKTDPWRVRNVIRWHRPNPPVGALGDKFRPSTSDVVVACKSAKRYFDLDAVRVPSKYADWDYAYSDTAKQGPDRSDNEDPTNGIRRNTGSHPAGAPPLDTWVIPTAPYKGSHYATFPPALVVKPVLAMCPERVCVVCGEPSRRIVEIDRKVDDSATPHGKSAGALHSGGPMTTKFQSTRNDLGWTDCECRTRFDGDKYRRGVVLDPFAGSGTTLAVATGHGRDAIGVDLDERNAELARERVGMFLSVEYPERVA